MADTLKKNGGVVRVDFGTVASEGSTSASFPSGYSASNSIVIGTYYTASSLEIYSGKIDVVVNGSYLTAYNHTGSAQSIHVYLQKKSST